MQNEEQKLEIVNYLEKASVAIFGLLFILLPLTFTNLTADFYILPKQALVVLVGLTAMTLYGIKTLLLEKVRIKRTPFDLPILLFLLALLLSSVFSVARAESFANLLPIIFAGIAYFGIVYNARNEKSVMVLAGSLLTGAVLLSIIAVFTYFKVYIFPFDFAKVQAFTPTGSVLDQALYLFFVLPIGLYLLAPFLLQKQAREALRNKRNDIAKLVTFSFASLIILIGLIISIYYLAKPGALILLPLETGFQTAFAAISQDSGRILQGLLFGSGFGEYFIDFAKFKQATFNANATLWNLPFIHSSSFVLELLATTGLLGLLSFLFICYKALKEKPLFIPLIIILATAFILPFSFLSLAFVFFVLAIYAILRGLEDEQKYFDVELELVAFKKGLLAFSPQTVRETAYGKALSYTIFGIILIIVLGLGFISLNYVVASMNFEKSAVAASQNNGQLMYNYQTNALSSLTGKYNDTYFRLFSQTNLTLANSLAASVPQGASPSAQTQQTIYTLVQQSINAGRQATAISPQNTLNWQNLAAIYRSLIGFGQNADSFAILAQQQAVQLDPANPQEYISLGGIYYQLGQWDQAQQQFQIAVNLKSDYPNAYYNLGHTLIQKGDLKGALAEFENVRSLVKNDPANLSKINSEIDQLQNQINGTAAQAGESTLSTNPSATNLPKQNPPVKIPAPEITLTPTVTPTPAPTTEGGLPLPTNTPTP
jgi:tetratricopeptide (TPR) repeat protein